MKLKKLSALLLALCMLLGMVSCDFFTITDPEDFTETPSDTTDTVTEDITTGTSEEKDTSTPENNDPPVDENVILLNSNTKGIKILGERYIPSNAQINCDWSGSGIEFSAFLTDRTVSFEVISSGTCYFRAYVDGAPWKTITGGTYYQVGASGLITLSGLPAGQHTIRLVKVTEASLATAAITKMRMTGVLQTTAPSKSDLYVEFVGGAETVGMGLIATNKNDHTAEDVTLAYPYLIANALKSDYAITALSQSIPLSTNGADAMGLYQLASPGRSETEAYSFARKANAVVVNLGASDFAAREQEGVTAEAFAASYEAFLQLIREKNGADCKIVCIYDAYCGEFSTAITNTLSKLGGQAAGFYSCQMTSGDGVMSVSEQAEFAVSLQTVLELALDGIITERELDTEENGDGLDISYDDFIDLTKK